MENSFHTFPTPSTSGNQAMTGANEKRYLCTICTNTFETISLVRWHWSNVHQLNNAQVCKICEIPFANKDLLQQHKHALHDVFCSLCGRGYNNVNQLDDHASAVHNTMLNYTCQICGMNFGRNKWLIDHMKEHESLVGLLGPLVFTCQACNTKFLEEKELRVHEKTHNKEWNCRVSKEQSFAKLKAPKKNKRNRRRRR